VRAIGRFWRRAAIKKHWLRSIARFRKAMAGALVLGWPRESEQQDFLSRLLFLKQQVACRELFSNYHGKQQ
jgi:hypothetical protein